MDVNDIIDSLYKVEELSKPDKREEKKRLDKKETNIAKLAKEARDAAWRAEEIAKKKL